MYHWEQDALVVARNRGMLPTAASRAIFSMAHDAMPEHRDRLAAGGTLLDIGSCVGGALLTMFPELRAVGVERAGDLVKELRERADCGSTPPTTCCAFRNRYDQTPIGYAATAAREADVA
ncbi:hypothetical protein ABGB14_49105 [Nonomuraea sp. B10E15]|uniref:hypothetical protein n=1 Tax=Nonomuraea sp. B10E15 TaxID=3153560 RepID=UPI00325EB97B